MKIVLVFGMTENPGGMESVIMNYYRHIDRTKVQFEFLCNTEIVAYSDEIESMGGIIHRITARSVNPRKYKKGNRFLRLLPFFRSLWLDCGCIVSLSQFHNQVV